ncbi:hypothetical protein C922_04373 [Plasmodium inui San Antonio 1]|uniref:Uncharacterized protein n=1 Tax=Plasmodium inui San Antonio 1 TaxID=1237626 RepID=W7A7Y6_9APIC|nr:hypothetical protein C922_04373 [Plasmodium inui San Antonio 1]EUD65244.1 hypothetical protein C922_04373 [Plasmodium inui San Antonio 1]
MHFFFAANKPPPSASLEHVQEDHVTLTVCLDDAQTHSGDVFRASFELVGPKKYAGNVKLDYVVVYLYGVYLLNHEVVTACTNGPLRHKQENLNLPFYGTNENDEQRGLLFYSNPIILCTDVNFGTPSETTHYHLSCVLPPFLPPSYNGKVIKFKYCMYVQAVKRLYRNRTHFVTQRYELHFPLRLLSGRCVRSPILDLVLFPIKPSGSQAEVATDGDNEGDPPEYLYHDFRVQVDEGGTTQGGTTQGDPSPARPSKKNPPTRGRLERVPLNTPSIPTHLYNYVGKTPLDRLLCIYLLSSQRKEDSSLFLLSHIMPNYNYFHYMHLFLYVVHHCDYYTGELSLNGDALRIGSLRAFFSMLRSFGEYPIEAVPRGSTPDEPNQRHDTYTGEKTNPMEEHLSSPQCSLQNDDNDMHKAYFCNYPNFVFNEINYVPIHWYDNLVLHRPSSSPIELSDEEDVSNLYLGEISSECSSSFDGANMGEERTTEGCASSERMKSQTVEETSHQGERHNATLPQQRKEGFLLDKAYTTVDTIVKCMHEEDMFRRINTRKVKPQRLSPNGGGDSTDKVVVSPEKKLSGKDNQTEKSPNKDPSQNIYRINSGEKNICLITLMDGLDQQLTDTFPCGGIINVRLHFGDATIFTVHVDIRLKRVERVKIDPRLLTLQRNTLHDENEIPDEEGNTSVDSEGTYHHCISSCKLISERNISTLHCSVKNVSFVLGEDVVPSFSNDTVRVGYLLDFDFFCLPKRDAPNKGGETDRDETNKRDNLNEVNEQKGSNQSGTTNEPNGADPPGGTYSGSLSLNEFLDDNIYSLTFRIPIHITERAHGICPHDASSNSNPTCHAKGNTEEGGITSQLLLQNSHKFLYADRRQFVRTLKM